MLVQTRERLFHHLYVIELLAPTALRAPARTADVVGLPVVVAMFRIVLNLSMKDRAETFATVGAVRDPHAVRDARGDAIVLARLLLRFRVAGGAGVVGSLGLVQGLSIFERNAALKAVVCFACKPVRAFFGVSKRRHLIRLRHIQKQLPNRVVLPQFAVRVHPQVVHRSTGNAHDLRRFQHGLMLKEAQVDRCVLDGCK